MYSIYLPRIFHGCIDGLKPGLLSYCSIITIRANVKAGGLVVVVIIVAITVRV